MHNYLLDNLVAIIDKNNFQQTGSNGDIMSVEDLAAKWSCFGRDVVEVDGHDIDELYDTFCRVNIPEKPVAIVANTIKGKGVSSAENNNVCHHAVQLFKADGDQDQPNQIQRENKCLKN